MTMPMQPSTSLPDPKYEAWVRGNIQKLRAAGFTDQEIRNDWLIGEQGMADTTADKFLPLAPVTGTPGVTAPRTSGIASDIAASLAPPGVGALMQALRGGIDPAVAMAPPGVGPGMQALDIQGPNALQNALGAGASALRGVTLGASDYIPPLKKVAAKYRGEHPVAATGVEMGAGMALNPFHWFRTAKDAATIVKAGLGAAAKRIGSQTAKGAAYGGVYGFNVGEGGLEGKALSGAFGMTGGAALGLGLGTVVTSFEHIAAIKAQRAATGLSPKSRELIVEAQKAQGTLRDPNSIIPGETLLDNAGPLEQSLVAEAVRRSPEGLNLANQVKRGWLESQQDAPLGLALEVAGVAPEQAGRFPNPLILARELRKDAKAAAAPLYARLNAENPAIPLTPELAAALESPTFKEFLTSRAFTRFVHDRAAADKARGIMGQATRGTFMAPEAIEAAMGGMSPTAKRLVASYEKAMGRQATPEQVQQIVGNLPIEPKPTFDWRTLNTAKLAIDQSLGREPVGSLAKMGRADLLATREALMRTLKQAPGYEEALNTYAGGHVFADMLDAGRAAARKGPNEAEALLTDPKTTALGAGAINQARLGILSELHRQLERGGSTARASGEVWTGDRIRLMKLAASTPEQGATVDAAVGAQLKRWQGLELIPQRVPGIQTRGAEQTRGALAGAAVAGGIGSGVGFRAGNVVQRLLGKMTPAEAFDIVRAYLNPDPAGVMAAIVGPFSRDASRVGEFGGRLAGLGVSAVQP